MRRLENRGSTPYSAPHLVRVDGVIVQRPKEGSHVQRRHHGGVNGAVNGDPSEQRAPVDGEAENSLWPVGEALGQGVARPQRCGCQPCRDRRKREGKKDGKGHG